ncbi:MAG: hypothetical protein J0I57_06750, partial [Hyphomicrobium sp.]|nr:hypothetical protein [Hyphomicrobium sp.]
MAIEFSPHEAIAQRGTALRFRGAQPLWRSEATRRPHFTPLIASTIVSTAALVLRPLARTSD